MHTTNSSKPFIDLLQSYDHIAWVPCISGRLDFKHACPGLGKGAISLHSPNPTEETSTKLYFILSSTKDWRDNKKGDGKFRVIMLGKEIEDHRLSGAIYILPESEVENSWKPIISIISSIKNTSPNRENFILEYEKIESLLSFSKINNTEFYIVDYILEKNGLVLLKYRKSSFCTDLESASFKETSFIITRQSYYYIKYALHRHKHHEHATDSLTTIYPISNPSINIGDKLCWDLQKSTIDIKRAYVNWDTIDRDHVYGRYSGILCYLKSLVLTCKLTNVMSHDHAKHTNQYISNVAESFNAMQTRQVHIKEQEKHAHQVARQSVTILVAFVSLSLLFFFNAYNITEKTPPTEFLSWIIEIPYSRLLSFAIITLGLYFSIISYFIGYPWLTRRFRRCRESVDNIGLIHILSTLLGAFLTLILGLLYLIFDCMIFLKC